MSDSDDMRPADAMRELDRAGEEYARLRACACFSRIAAAAAELRAIAAELPAIAKELQLAEELQRQALEAWIRISPSNTARGDASSRR